MDPSDDNASRSSMLRQQRETALRRRSNQMPPPKSSDGNCEDGGRPSSTRRMSSATTTAMADVMAWEGAKKRERIDARIREEEIRRAEEARMRAEAEAEEEEVVRRAEMEKYEKRQLRVQKQLELEHDAREKVARKLEDEKAEARKLAEAKAEAHRLEKERLEKERLEKERLEKDRLEKDKMADLERRLAEAEKARIEAERLAERACRLSAPFQTNGSNDPKCNSSSERAPHPDPKNGHHSANNGTRTGHQRWPSLQMNQTGLTVPDEQDRQTMACNKEMRNKEMHEQFIQDTTCNSGYQRYLSTFHQPSCVEDGRCGGGAVSSEGDSPAGFAPVLQADRNRPTTAHSKIKRSVSTRSLTFTNIDATDKVEQPESSGKDAPQKEVNNVQSLQHITSIESVNLDDPICLFSFLMKPCPKGLGMIQCCVRRNKGIKNALFPEYRMYLKSSERKSESFLMTSKKRGKKPLYSVVSTH